MASPAASTVWAALLLLSAALAGCNGTTQGTTSPTGTTSPPPWTATSSTTSTSPPATFDGQAALSFVHDFAVRADGSPRYRIPGTIGQQEGGEYLWAQMDLPGWTRSWQNFTGTEYFQLDRSPVAGFGSGNLPCSGTVEQAKALPFRNLLAVRRGDSLDESRPLLALAAHWDTQMHSDFDPDPMKRCQPDPGANDGASGVGLLLQLMRELDGVELPFDVAVLFLDGEDGFFDNYPLAGSLYFAQNPPVEVDRFLLLDMVGDPGARYIRETSSTRSDPNMMDLLWRHGHALGGRDHFTQKGTGITDDHVAFIAAGIPSVDIIDAGRDDGFGFPPQWDTTNDTVEKLRPQMLALVGSTLLATLQDPALAADWPSGNP